MRSQGLREVIGLVKREPTSRRFFFSYLQSSVGAGAAWPALVLLASDQWSSPLAITLVLLADEVPSIALSPIFGKLADKFPRHHLMAAADLLRAGAFGGMVLAQSFELVFALALVGGIGTAMYSPAARSAAGQITAEPPDERTSGAIAKLYSQCLNWGWTVGPLIAAVLLSFSPARLLLGINAVTFLIAAGISLSLKLRELSPEEENDDPVPAGPDHADSPVGGWAMAGRHGVARRVVVTAAAICLFAATINVILLPYITDHLDRGGGALGWLAAVTGVGAVAAVLLPARQTRRAMLMFFAAAAGIYGIAMIVMAAAPVLLLASVMKFIQGAANTTILANQMAYLQQAVPERQQGTVWGLMDSYLAAAMVGAFFLGGGVSAAVGEREALLVAGVGLLVVSSVFWLSLRGRKL